MNPTDNQVKESIGEIVCKCSAVVRTELTILIYVLITVLQLKTTINVHFAFLQPDCPLDSFVFG